jgi:hypothetical protein
MMWQSLCCIQQWLHKSFLHWTYKRQKKMLVQRALLFPWHRATRCQNVRCEWTYCDNLTNVWRFKSSGMWHCVIGWVIPHV